MLQHAGQLIHRRAPSDGNFEARAQLPSLRVEYLDVYYIFLHVQLLIKVDLLYSDGSLFDELLLPHRLLSVYLGHPFSQLLAETDSIGLKLYPTKPLEHLQKQLFAVLSLEVAIDRNIGDLLESAKAVQVSQFCGVAHMQQDPHFSRLGRNSFL